MMCPHNNFAGRAAVPAGTATARYGAFLSRRAPSAPTFAATTDTTAAAAADAAAEAAEEKGRGLLGTQTHA